MTTKKTSEPPKKRPRTGFKEGDKIVCVKSASFAYTKGGTYEVYLNDKGHKCITGNDGLEDLLSMVVSSFKRVD